MKFKSTKQFLNYLFEANQDKTDDIVVFLNGKLKGKHLDVDDEIMEKLNSLKGVQLTKALEWFYEKPVTMTYDKDITNKYKGSSSITNYIKNLMREKEVEVPEKLKESYFDLKHWQKMAGIKKILKENNQSVSPPPNQYDSIPNKDALFDL